MPHRPHPKVDRDIDTLRETILRMAQLAEAILDKSLAAVWERSPALASEVMQDDIEIDRLDVEIDGAVLRILALDAPVARDLRLVVAIKAIATDLERVGDLARNIAGCARRLAPSTAFNLPPEIHSLADDSRAALRAASQAFANVDAVAAREVIAQDDHIDDLQDEIVRDAITRLTAAPETTEQEIDVIFIAQHLERIGDHATNLAEEVVLVAEARNLKHSERLGSN
jgi:phosphate transport system protein